MDQDGNDREPSEELIAHVLREVLDGRSGDSCISETQSRITKPQDEDDLRTDAECTGSWKVSFE